MEELQQYDDGGGRGGRVAGVDTGRGDGGERRRGNFKCNDTGETLDLRQMGGWRWSCAACWSDVCQFTVSRVVSRLAFVFDEERAADGPPVGRSGGHVVAGRAGGPCGMFGKNQRASVNLGRDAYAVPSLGQQADVDDIVECDGEGDDRGRRRGRRRRATEPGVGSAGPWGLTAQDPRTLRCHRGYGWRLLGLSRFGKGEREGG